MEGDDRFILNDHHPRRKLVIDRRACIGDICFDRIGVDVQNGRGFFGREAFNCGEQDRLARLYWQIADHTVRKLDQRDHWRVP